jgi:hypothetical protein
MPAHSEEQREEAQLSWSILRQSEFKFGYIRKCNRACDRIYRVRVKD